eukprot:gene5255-6082_t
MYEYSNTQRPIQLPATNKEATPPAPKPPPIRKPFQTLREKILGKKAKVWRPYVSPFTTRELKSYVRRDYESAPLRLQLLRELHQFFIANGLVHRSPFAHDYHPIDYKYLTPELVDKCQLFLCDHFWPGIELNEILEYPDFTVCVLYRSMVIGCGIMNPDGYIMFLLVHPEWQGQGIASFMLYHLTQTMVGKDITLHVSVNNAALILYQQFGFKIEEFIHGFYDKYYDDDSGKSKNAFLLRLHFHLNKTLNMSTALYNDLVKVPADLIKKDFPETQSIEVNNTNIAGLPFNLTSTILRKADGSVVLTANPKLNLDSRFKNAKLSLTGDSNQTGKGEITFEKLAPGLKAILTADTQKIVQAEFQYKINNLAFSTLVKSNKTLTQTAVIGYNNFSVGVSANANAEKGELTGLDATFLYKKDGLTVGFSPKNKGQSLMVTLYDKVNAKLALAADLTVDLKSPEKSPQFNIGSQYYVASNSFIKTKINQDLRVGVAYTVPINENIKLNAGLNINAKNLSAEGKHTYGFLLTLNF